MSDDLENEPRCALPPPEWWCSRPFGHSGPCAARPANDALDECTVVEVNGGSVILRGLGEPDTTYLREVVDAAVKRFRAERPGGAG